MRTVVCPECGEEWMVASQDLVRGSQLQCDECGSILVVSSENPLKLVVDEASEIGDEYDELDEIDEFEDDGED